MANKAVKYEKVTDIDTDIDITLTEDTEHQSHHPLESPLLLACAHYVFHTWVFKLLSLCQQPTLSINDVPNLPQKLRVANAYREWIKIYNDRKDRHLSTTTLAMIYNSEKYRIMCAVLLLGINTLGVFYIEFILVRDHLYDTLLQIALKSKADSPMNLMWDLSKYAILIFMFAMLGCFCTALSRQLNTQTVVRSVGCIQYQLFTKLLSLDMSESDKQRLLSIVGAELSTLSTKLSVLFVIAPTCVYLLIALTILLHKSVGTTAFFGVAFILFVSVPFQLFAGLKYSKNQKARMCYSGKRVQLITQLISGIRFLKCNVSETALMQRINELRIKELLYVKKSNIYVSVMFLLNLLTPSLMIFVLLMVYMFVFENSVTVMTVLSLVMTTYLVRNISTRLPLAVGAFGLVLSTSKRIDEFLSKREKLRSVYNGSILQNNDTMLEIKNAFFAWNNTSILKNISLKIGKGKLIAIVGTVGSGKTSLIQSILGEMKCVKGSIDVSVNKYGYIAQSAYIQNATFRDNIIMDLAFNEEKYKKCIFSADLCSDLKRLPFGDLTQIGTEGINISGGQKMRLCFARALYRREEYDLFLFDDPLSAVDIYVGKHMFFNGILAQLQLKQTHKTCLMTINSHLYLLKHFDQIIIVENGEIKLHTETAKLFNNSDLYQKYSYLLPEINQTKSAEAKEEKLEQNIDSTFQNIDQNNYLRFHEQNRIVLPGFREYAQMLKYSLINVDYEQEYYTDNSATQTGNLKCRLTLMISLILVLCSISCLLILCNVWLVVWRENVDKVPFSNVKWIPISDRSTVWYFAVWFAVLAFIVCMTFLLLYYIGNVVLIKASHSIFAKTLLNILKCNTLFFDIIPRGQILNVLSSDPNTMDNTLGTSVFYALMLFSSLFGFFVMIAAITPSILLLCVFFVLPISFIIARKIKTGYHALTVLWKASLSPVLSLFDESIAGLDSIRAYALEPHFLSVIRQRIDTVGKCKFNSGSIRAWAGLYLNVFLHFCLVLIIIYFGLVLLYFDLKQDINLLLLSIWWYFSGSLGLMDAIIAQMHIDTDIASVQRMFFYCDNELNIDDMYKSQKQRKKSKNINTALSDSKWPCVGDLSIQKLQLKYRQNFDIVLNIEREINIKPGTKLAICGRTGSGKSSMLVSIFRLFEPSSDSQVFIDKVNIFELGLFDVRSNISIIMQTSMMFTGTLRFNLDPFSLYTDNEIWNALKEVQLFELIRNREHCLYCEVGENGSFFSVGEAQLLCFARAILKNSKILFMDEPTSSIDKATDKVIQKLIRSERFKKTTVICIAHRLQTILDYDYILLLENGKVLEYDKPSHLINDKTSQFYNLLCVSNLYHKA